MNATDARLVVLWRQKVASLSREDDPFAWAEAMFHLGNALQEGANTDPSTAEGDDTIEEAIDVYRLALTVRTQATSPVAWAETMINLANALADRRKGAVSVNRRQAVATIEGAIMALDPKAEPERWGLAYYNLGTILQAGSDPDDPRQAAEALNLCLSVFDQDEYPEYWASATWNLALAQTRRIDDPAGSIELALDALTRLSQFHLDRGSIHEWASTQAELGVTFLRRLSGAPADPIDQAIRCFDDALKILTPDTHPLAWSRIMDHRGTACLRRMGGVRANNVEEAIAHYRQALEVRTRKAHPAAWAATMMNLATAYRNRIRGERLDNLELAIDCCHQALEVRTRENDAPGWATVQMNLGIIYGHRIQGDRIANRELAIECYERALEVFSIDSNPLDWALTTMNLGTAFFLRSRGSPEENLGKAIKAFRDTLRVRKREQMPLDWSISMANLGCALARWPQASEENIEEALAALEAALTVQTPEAMPFQWVQTMGNLGSCLAQRIRGELDENLRRARQTLKHVLALGSHHPLPLELAHIQTNLGYVCAELAEMGFEEFADEAVLAYRRALEVFHPKLLPEPARRTAHQLGVFLARRNRWQEAEPVFRHQIQAMNQIYRSSVLLESREAEQAATPEAEANAAYAFAKVGDLEAAILTLEQSRVRRAREVLARDRADTGLLRSVHPELLGAFEQAASALREFESLQRSLSQPGEDDSLSYPDLLELGLTLQETFEKTLEAIRALPGFSDFLELPSAKSVREAIRCSSPVIFLIVSSFGSLALLAHSDKRDDGLTLRIFWNPLTSDELDELLVERSGGQVAGYLIDQFRLMMDPSSVNKRAFEQRLELVNRKVSDWLGPLLQELRQEKSFEVGIVAGGRTALLPIHAIGTEEDSFCAFALRFLPSVDMAQLARQARAHQARLPIQRVLAVGHSGTRPLPYAQAEIQAIAAHSGGNAQVLRGDDATASRLESLLEAADCLHLACHASFDTEHALNSGMELADSRWTLRRILEIAPKLGSLRLVVLSACQSGLHEWQRVPDELLGIPMGFAEAGVPTVVAALWPADDLASFLFMESFYDHLFSSPSQQPAGALAQARAALRSLTVADLRTRLRSGSAEDPLRAWAPQILARLLPLGLDNRAFSSPYYWAPYYCFGV